MRYFVSLAFTALLTATPALAYETIGPADVVDLDAVMRDCNETRDIQLFLDCLDKSGVAPSAIAFARALTEDPRVVTLGLVTEFTELGEVDLAEVNFPFLANTNQQSLFVNGDFGVLQPNAMILPAFPEDAISRGILAEFPDAVRPGRYRVEGMRIPAPGLQRFVLTDTINDGCRGCEPAADEIYWVEFQDGAFQGVQTLGVYPLGLFDPGARAAALMTGDNLPLQIALAMRGYDPGPLNAQSTSATQSALEEFQSAMCLDAEALGSAAALALLASDDRSFSEPAACPGR